MREIKFRVWDGDSLSVIDFYWFEEHYIRSISDLDNGYKLMMFTGLSDTNGVDIYEGDIVEVFGDASVISWSDSNTCFNYQGISAPYSIDRLGKYSKPAFKVIGNIHQNPDMLIV